MYHYCPNGGIKLCKGPGYTCSGFEMEYPAKPADEACDPATGPTDPDNCQCPIGRRLMINPEGLTCMCYGEGWEMVPETYANYCPDGGIKYCDGPGWVCKDGE